MKRKGLCLLLALCLVLSLAVPAAAAEERDMLGAFVDYMNQKAEAIGMSGSKFYDPIGMNNFTTARDFLKLMVWAAQYRELVPVWGAEAYTVTVTGENARQQTVVSTIRGNEHLDPYYTVLGCKDGELPAYEVRNLAVILQVPDSREKLAVVVLGAYGQNGQTTGSRAMARKVADLALERLKNPEADLSGEKLYCRSAMACLVTEEDEEIRILYEKDPDQQIMTASIAKVLTAVCLLDVQRELEESFSYHNFDTNIGGFYAHDFHPGDSMTFRDGLYALLLPSSNVTARALARTAGEKILREGAPDPTVIPRWVPETMIEGSVAAAVVVVCAANALETA